VLEFNLLRPFNSKNKVLRCPECDAKQSKNYSRQGVAWLLYLEKRLGVQIQKATSAKGEAKVTVSGKSTSVEGFVKRLEYHGSRWHGNSHTVLS
jgi:uncharacterized C2H2 Zn-finger protein